MTDINDLKAENNRLRSMLARAGISILPAADLPNDQELNRLLEMVERAHPLLKCPEGVAANNKQQFAHALHFLVYVYRIDRPNTQYAMSYWMDMCRDWPWHARATTSKRWACARSWLPR